MNPSWMEAAMLWGALNNASTAMQAMTSDLGTISQNVANINTTGYKRKDTEFKTMVSEGHAAPAAPVSGLTVFGVRSFDRTMISQQGVITPSTNWSDLAINGSGMFVVAVPDGKVVVNGRVQVIPPSNVSLSNPNQAMYTRAGNFQQLAVGDKSYFTTADGNFVMGWQADTYGNIPGVATSAGNPAAAAAAPAGAGTGGGTLVPVYTQPNQTMAGLATTSIQAVATLPANAPLAASTAVTNATIKDNNGVDQQLTGTWTRTDGDTWTVAFSVTGGGTVPPATVTMDASGHLLTPAGGSQTLTVDWGGGVTTTPTVNLGASLPAETGVPMSLTVYDQAYNAHTVTASFERTGSGTWYMHVQLPTVGATPDGTLTSLTGSNGTSGTFSVPVTFDGAGKITSPQTVSMGINWTTPNPSLQPTDPSYGVAPGTNTITLDLSSMTQYSTDNSNKVAIKTIDQDGYASGIMDQMNFNQNGELVAHFTNGHSRTLFMLPVASFVSENQLDPVSGTMFRRTQAAGDVTIGAISDQGSGASISPNSIEQSNVDLASEFSKMIVTQKAYSTNATVFKTADEMTTTVRDLIV
jgi:flagellar hook protein FlgE